MPKVVDHEQRREEIVAAMWRVVERDGATAVSVRSVATEAGISKTGMSYYFASQGELLASAIEVSVETVTDRILQMDLLDCDVQTAVSALMELIPGDELRRQQARVWLQLLALEQVDPSIAPVLHTLNVAVRDGVVVVLTALANQGLVDPSRSIVDEAVDIHATIDGFSMHALTDIGLDSRERMRSAMVHRLTQLRSPIVV